MIEYAIVARRIWSELPCLDMAVGPRGVTHQEAYDNFYNVREYRWMLDSHLIMIQVYKDGVESHRITNISTYISKE